MPARNKDETIYADEHLVLRLKAIMRGHANDGMLSGKIHELLAQDQGVTDDGKPIKLHVTQVWEIVDHAFRREYEWARQFVLQQRNKV